MKEDAMDKKIILELSVAEALVFFDFLSRFTEKEKLEINNQAEERVLWDICSFLEKNLVEPFKENYIQLLQKAREKIRDKTDS